MDAKNIMTIPVEDIIFENRNKEYGAYDIRQRYNRNLGIATAVAISGLLLFIFGPILIDQLMPDEVVVVDNTRTTVTELGPPPSLDERTPPPPPEEIIKPPEQIKFTEPEVTIEQVDDDPPPPIDDIRDKKTGGEDVDGPVDPDPGPPPGGDPIKPPDPPKNENFEFAQELPKQKINLQEFFNTHADYPDLAMETRLEGTVHVRAVVKTDGSIDKSTITIGKGLKNGGAGLNNEALRLVKMIPDGSFTPGNNNGNAVNVWISIPVRFALGDE